MYFGGGNVSVVNPQNVPLAFEYVTACLKGREDGFTLKGGDATGGMLATMYDGVRPTSRNTYQPMRKQGAIILATGGDSSNRARGTFYEGFMAMQVRKKSTHPPPIVTSDKPLGLGQSPLPSTAATRAT